jgi:hypothetical protein
VAVSALFVASERHCRGVLAKPMIETGGSKGWPSAGSFVADTREVEYPRYHCDRLIPAADFINDSSLAKSSGRGRARRPSSPGEGLL